MQLCFPDEPLQHMLDVHLIDCFQTKNKNENVSESPTATAVACCSCDELRLSLVLAEERENPVCVLKFIDMSMMVHRGGGGGKVVLTLNVRGLTGTAGHMTSDTLPCQRYHIMYICIYNILTLIFSGNLLDEVLY